MITNSETSETVSMWLEWLKKEVEFTPKTIMIDCSPVEINAIRVVFQELVQILLCHWHIKHVWDKKIKKDVSIVIVIDILVLYLHSKYIYIM